MNVNDIIAEYLQDSAKRVKRNDCGLYENEIVLLASLVVHVKLNKTQAADFLHISTRTLDRRIASGQLPSGRKDAGSNLLYWYQDELINYGE